jgi:translation initiation factor 6
MTANFEMISVFGNPNIGVYLFTNDDYTFVPPGVEEKVIRTIENVLKTTVVQTRIADSTLLGIFVAGNNHALILPRIVKDYEVEKLKSEVDMPIKVLDSKATAMGNVIVANSRFALLSPELKGHEAEVSKVLGVPTEVRSVANIPTVGSVLVVNDKGGVAHPDASDEELDYLGERFGVEIDVATVNYGVPFVKTGIVANNKGALLGELTTGIEANRIVSALFPEEGS